MSTNVFSGARAIFMINGKKVAWASGVSGGEEIVFEPVETLDNVEVQEFVPVGYRVNLSCEMFRTISGTPGSTAPPGSTGSVKAAGIFPSSAGSPSAILTTGEMTAIIKDRLTNQTILRVEGVKAASYNFSITSRGLVGQNVSFVALRAKDESEVP